MECNVMVWITCKSYSYQIRVVSTHITLYNYLVLWEEHLQTSLLLILKCIIHCHNYSHFMCNRTPMLSLVPYTCNLVPVNQPLFSPHNLIINILLHWFMGSTFSICEWDHVLFLCLAYSPISQSFTIFIWQTSEVMISLYIFKQYVFMVCWPL